MSRLIWPDDETLSLYIAGALPPEVASRVGALVAEDPELAERVAEESLLLAGLMEGSAMAPEPAFWEDLSSGIMARIEAESAAEAAAEAAAETELQHPKAACLGSMGAAGAAAFGEPRKRREGRPSKGGFTLLKGGGLPSWVIPTLGGGIAMAAALALMVRAPINLVDPTPSGGSSVAAYDGALEMTSEESLGTNPATFEGITIASLLGEDTSPDLGIFEEAGNFSLAQLQGEALSLEGLDLGVEPIQILDEGEPESVQELSDDQIETLMLALDKAMMG